MFEKFLNQRQSGIVKPRPGLISPLFKNHTSRYVLKLTCDLKLPSSSFPPLSCPYNYQECFKTHLSNANLELEWLVPVVRRVELGSILELSGVVHGQEVAVFGLLLTGVGLGLVVDLELNDGGSIRKVLQILVKMSLLACFSQLDW